MSRGRGVTLPDSDQLDFAFILVASFPVFFLPRCQRDVIDSGWFTSFPFFFFQELLMLYKRSVHNCDFAKSLLCYSATKKN